MFTIRSYLSANISDANPLDYRWVDPDKIKYNTRTGRYRYGDIFQHDIEKTQFEDTNKYKMFDTVFCGNENWKETKSIQQKIKKKADRNHRFNQDIDSLVSEYTRIYEDIRLNGYKNQIVLRREEKIGRRTMADSEHFHWACHEIQVIIDSDGSIIRKGGGHHRLAIAKILELDSVPVLVRARHQAWQDIRNEVRNSKSVSELSQETKQFIGHPDLNDVLPDEVAD